MPKPRMSVSRHVLLLLGTLLLSVAGAPGGCTCISIVPPPPGPERADLDDAGARESGAGRDDPTEAAADGSIPGRDGAAKESAPELLDGGPVDDRLAHRCPDVSQVSCEICTFTLHRSERVVTVSRGYALVWGEGGGRFVSLRDCSGVKLEWNPSSVPLGTIRDPDSGRILVVVAPRTTLRPATFSFAFFDPPATKPVALFSLTASWTRWPRTLPEWSRRGVISYLWKKSGTTEVQTHIRFRFRGAQLTELPVPQSNTLLLGNYHCLLPHYEVYTLRQEKGGAVIFPLLVWSVAENRQSRIIPRTGSVASSLFTSQSRVFVLSPVNGSYGEKKLEVWDAKGSGPAQELPAPGCKWLVGSSAADVVACMADGKMYRFRMKDLKQLPPVSVPKDVKVAANYSGTLFLTSKSDPRKVLRVALAGQRTTPDEIPSSLRVDGMLLGPWDPQDRSQHTTPGPPYRLLRTDWEKDTQRLAVLDLPSGRVRPVGSALPAPAVMGRLTEGLRFFARSFSYYIEPDNRDAGPAVYHVRIDRAELFGTTQAGLASSSPRWETVPARIEAWFQPADRKWLPGKWSLGIVDHGRFLIERTVLTKRHDLQYDDHHLLLTPVTDPNPPTERTVRVRAINR